MRLLSLASPFTSPLSLGHIRVCRGVRTTFLDDGNQRRKLVHGHTAAIDPSAAQEAARTAEPDADDVEGCGAARARAEVPQHAA